MFTAKVREKSIRKMRSERLLSIFLIPIAALIMGVTAPGVWAEDGEFDVAKLFFELNDSDGDLGIHGLIDGDAWKRLSIEDPRERSMLNIFVRGRLNKQGLTELFFESAEPSFDELPAREFFHRFPQGLYEIEGLTLEGEELANEVWLSHRMPAPADVTVNELEIIPSGECGEDPEPTEVSPPVVIAWEQVRRSHPNIGWPQDKYIKVVLYQVVVEWEDDEENVFVFNAEFAHPRRGESMRVTVPPEFLPVDTEFKIEVLVRAENGNQTAVESCPFILVEE